MGHNLNCNYKLGPYQVDFFVAKLLLVLECNGYCHRHYDPVQEKKREAFITKKYGLVRFHHTIDLETLVNGILQAQPGKVIQLYDLQNLSQEMLLGLNVSTN
ncbi:hypothetical protein TI05_09360 [Achromatium sp. WMS3]|nr:hypothetical protein TI05_09360 [Achromatium sp. WMS3]